MLDIFGGISQPLIKNLMVHPLRVNNLKSDELRPENFTVVRLFVKTFPLICAL